MTGIDLYSRPVKLSGHLNTNEILMTSTKEINGRKLRDWVDQIFVYDSKQTSLHSSTFCSH